MLNCFCFYDFILLFTIIFIIFFLHFMLFCSGWCIAKIEPTCIKRFNQLNQNLKSQHKQIHSQKHLKNQIGVRLVHKNRFIKQKKRLIGTITSSTCFYFIKSIICVCINRIYGLRKSKPLETKTHYINYIEF